MGLKDPKSDHLGSASKVDNIFSPRRHNVTRIIFTMWDRWGGEKPEGEKVIQTGRHEATYWGTEREVSLKQNLKVWIAELKYLERGELKDGTPDNQIQDTQK